MTPDQWIALCASLGACLSAVATFLTVRQIAKQREASYRPELAISRIQFQAYPDPLRGGMLPTKWTAQDTKEGETLNCVEDLALPLRNIGLGSARAVSLQWDFDVTGAVNAANELAQQTLTPAYFSTDDRFVTLKSEDLGNGSSMWENQRNVLIDYVLPASVEKSSLRVRLPHAYIQLASALVYLRFKEKEKTDFFDLPLLTASFTFSDIGGIKHSAYFNIKICPVSLSSNSEAMTMEGYVECSKQC